MPVKSKPSSRPDPAEPRVTHVAIIGAGAGGSALLTVLAPDPLVRIVGVAEVDPKAPGLRLAKRYGIPVTRNFRDLLSAEELDLCRELIFSDPTRSFELLSDAKAQLKTAIDESRQVIFNLRPLYFESMELVPALKNYLKSYETQSHIRTELIWSGDESAMAPTTKIVLFRIVQEALSNVQKHAKADRATITLAVAESRIKGTIEDNGIGFDVEAMSQDPTKWQSFGLKGIHERARLVGGTARVESRKGQGTRVLVDIPITPEEERRRGADQGPDRR